MVQQLAAVEGLAAVDVLCTDKTGTLTTGRQSLDRIVPFSESEADVRRWLGAFAANSIDQRNKSIGAMRDALGAVAPAVEVIDQLPFQSQNRCSAAVLRIDGSPRLFALGSVEALRTRFSDEYQKRIEAEWTALLPTGLRLLAFADGPAPEHKFDGKLPEVPLRPLALVGLRDELRPEVTTVLAALAEQGIRFKVVSGDHPETVRATVGTLGSAFAESQLLTGDEWMASADRTAAAESCDVFGRVSPEQKLALVDALQRAGRTVGMIGDGVNDILPIKRADFGVAMGAGSPATKMVAGVVLENDDFAALPTVLAEGRRVVENVRRAAKLFLLKNMYTVALVLIAVGLCGLPFPYLPQQVTLLNALTIGGPAILILAGRSTHTRAVGLNFFADIGRFVLVAGGVTSVVGAAVYLGSSLGLRHDTETARTLLLMTLILAGVGNAIVATNGDRRLIAWAGFAVVVLVVVNLIPPVAYFFALQPMTVTQWVAVVLAAACAVVPGAVFRRPAKRA
jgi:cation-transporting ATPase E